jgi:deoxyribodipyrimidine photolyase
MRFLLESLKDLNDTLTLYGGCLYILQGNPVNVFKEIKEKIGLDVLTFEQVMHFFEINIIKSNLKYFSLMFRTVNTSEEFVIVK